MGREHLATGGYFGAHLHIGSLSCVGLFGCNYHWGRDSCPLACSCLAKACGRSVFIFIYLFFVLPFRRLCFSYLVIPGLNLCNEKHYFVVSSTSPSLPLLCFGFRKIEETYRCKKRNSQNFYQRKIKKASNLNDAKGSSKHAQKSLDQTWSIWNSRWGCTKAGCEWNWGYPDGADPRARLLAPSARHPAVDRFQISPSQGLRQKRGIWED